MILNYLYIDSLRKRFQETTKNIRMIASRRALDEKELKLDFQKMYKLIRAFNLSIESAYTPFI